MIYELTLVIIGGVMSLILGFILIIFLLFKYNLIEAPIDHAYNILVTNDHDLSSDNNIDLHHSVTSHLDWNSELEQSSVDRKNDLRHLTTCLAGWARLKTTYLMEDGFEDFPSYCLVSSQYSTHKKPLRDQKYSTTPDMNASINTYSDHKDRIYYKYLFLKGRNLFIYSSDKREHCDGIVTLTNDCTVTLIPNTLLVEELFCKQYPIMVTNHSNQIIGSSHTCYIYAANCSEKEDWYKAILGACRENSLDKSHKYRISTFGNHIKDIQSPLLDQNTQWFNALLTRLSINACMSVQFEEIILEKLNRKTSRLRKPFFVGEILVKEVSLGTRIPLFGKCQLHSFEPSGEVNVSADVLYTGGFQVIVSTTARLDLPKMKPITIPLLLSILTRRISGRVLFRIKAPPTDRVWIGFYGLPNMDLKIDPIVSTKSINLAMVHSIIRRRIEDVLMEYMVLPNMDDWVIPSTENRYEIEEKNMSQSPDIAYTSSCVSSDHLAARRRTVTTHTETRNNDTSPEMMEKYPHTCSTSMPSLPLDSLSHKEN